jgi:hypothetical protein
MSEYFISGTKQGSNIFPAWWLSDYPCTTYRNVLFSIFWHVWFTHFCEYRACMRFSSLGYTQLTLLMNLDSKSWKLEDTIACFARSFSRCLVTFLVFLFVCLGAGIQPRALCMPGKRAFQFCINFRINVLGLLIKLTRTWIRTCGSILQSGDNWLWGLNHPSTTPLTRACPNSTNKIVWFLFTKDFHISILCLFLVTLFFCCYYAQ